MVNWEISKLQLEIVNKCNFKCPLCKTLVRDDGVERRKINVEELSSIILPIKKELKEVTLYGTRGEPFLHKDLEEIVEFIKSNTQANVIISTNGSRCVQTRLERLFGAGLDEIIFAIDGISQSSTNAYRLGGKVEELLRNLKVACETKKSLSAVTKIIWQFIPMKHNEHEIDEVKALAKSYGVDELKLKFSSSVEKNLDFRPVSTQTEMLEQSDYFFCPSGLDKLYVDPNGDAFPCCYAEGEPGLKIGNVFKENIKDVWNCNELWELRRSFIEQTHFNEFCKKTCLNSIKKKKRIIYKSEV